MKKFILINILFILTACSVSGSELSQNQTKWQNANIAHYRYQLSVGCFCVFRDKMPLTIEVQNGQVVSMKYSDGTAVSAEEQANMGFAQYATIDNLFKYTEQRSKDAEKVDVKYDATYGYPTEVSIDGSQQIADDELYLSVSGFEKLQ